MRYSYGADGVCPYVAYEAIAKMNHEGLVYAKAKEDYSNADLFKAYRKSVAKGILKVMSKMGISTLQSYKGAQVWLVCVVGVLISSIRRPRGTFCSNRGSFPVP